MNRYAEENLKRIISNSSNYNDCLRGIGLSTSGNNLKTLKKYILKYNIDISHFIKKRNRRKWGLDEILIKNSPYTSTNHLKIRLYKLGLKERKCENCGQGEEWKGKKMSLILDHINGVNDDNRLENLRVLCPNCNATLPTHCGKNNKARNKKKVKDEFSISNKVDFRKIKTEAKKKAHIERRVVKDRPSIHQLTLDIKELGFVGAGKKYGVSDNSIRKWVKSYGKNPKTIK